MLNTIWQFIGTMQMEVVTEAMTNPNKCGIVIILFMLLCYAGIIMCDIKTREDMNEI